MARDTIECPKVGDVYRMTAQYRNMGAFVKIVKILDDDATDWYVMGEILSVPSGIMSLNSPTRMSLKTVRKLVIWEKVDPIVWDKAMKLRSVFQNGLAVLFRDSEKIE